MRLHWCTSLIWPAFDGAEIPLFSALWLISSRFFSQDNCPRHFNPAQYNNEGDPYGNDWDNCPYVTNKFQSDNDKDGIGDACDKDVDGDGKMKDWGLVGELDLP